MTLIEESRSHPHEVIVKQSAIIIQLTEERDRLRKALETFASVESWGYPTQEFLLSEEPWKLAANALEGKK